MKCGRCSSELTRVEDDASSKKAAKALGVPYGGSWVCATCYPEKVRV